MKRLLFVLCVLYSFCASAAVYNVKDFGAKGDGITLDTKAFNDAIAKASQDGGGTVLIPSGQYLCKSIRLASHVHLYIEKGAVVIAAEGEGYDSPEPNEFDMYQDYGHSHWMDSLIWGIGLEDITISGDGMIYGRGLTAMDLPNTTRGNKTISLKLCKNITIRDISMLQCGHFALLATGVDNLSIYNVKVDSNRDGFNIDCCKNVRISNCSMNTPSDDAIVLKATYSLGYFRDTENVTVSDCLVSGYEQGSLLKATWDNNVAEKNDHVTWRRIPTGRIKLGTESSGGFKNIAVSNCIFDNCRGLAIESVDGGHLEDMVVSNITMRNCKSGPIFLRLGARQRSPKGTPLGTLKRVLISNVNVFNAVSDNCSTLAGIPGAYIEDVVLSNIHIWSEGGGTAEDGKRQPKEEIESYPEPGMFGVTPAKGLYIRHAKNITFRDVNFHFLKPDYRPLIVEEDTEAIQYDGVTVDYRPSQSSDIDKR